MPIFTISGSPRSIGTANVAVPYRSRRRTLTPGERGPYLPRPPIAPKALVKVPFCSRREAPTSAIPNRYSDAYKSSKLVVCRCLCIRIRPALHVIQHSVLKLTTLQPHPPGVVPRHHTAQASQATSNSSHFLSRSLFGLLGFASRTCCRHRGSGSQGCAHPRVAVRRPTVAALTPRRSSGVRAGAAACSTPRSGGHIRPGNGTAAVRPRFECRLLSVSWQPYVRVRSTARQGPDGLRSGGAQK